MHDENHCPPDPAGTAAPTSGAAGAGLGVRSACTVIRAAWADRTLLDLLCNRFTYHSREEWQLAVAAGRVLLNHRPAAEADVVHAGDRLEYLAPDLREPAVDLRYGVLYEDDCLLAVDKPANLPCHPSGRFFRHTLWAILQERHGIPTPRFVNRLDRETSGIVLVAKTAAAARACGMQNERGTIRKEYLAIAEGCFPELLHARGWMTAEATAAVRKIRRFHAESDPSPPLTGAEWAEAWFTRQAAAGGLSLLRVRLGTGRTHQIRAMLATVGFPLVGDKLYGRDAQIFLRYVGGALSAADREALRLPRQALHAASLCLRHPDSGAELAVEAPIPADMGSLLAEVGIRVPR